MSEAGTMSEKDYSTTPLWKKLGIKQNSRVAFLGAPPDFARALGALPPGVVVATRPGGALDVIVAFETRLARLRNRFVALAHGIDSAGGLWIAYPKKSSNKPTDLTFENVQRTGLDNGLVDNKSCAVDETWSAVRFVYRLEDRSKVRRT